MVIWRLKAFTADFDETVVLSWYHQQPIAVQDEFEARLNFLASSPIEYWSRPYAAKLRGKCKGLMEIRFDVNNVEHRPIGYISGDREFTLLAFATERDGKFDPKEVCDTAKKRKKLIEKEARHSREFKF